LGVLDAVLADRRARGVGLSASVPMDDSANLGDRVTEILGPWLAGEGLHVLEAGKRAARWARPDGVAIQFECYEEDPPPRPLGVALGETHADGSFTAVGAWALVPDDAAGRGYSLWRFRTRQELDHVLRRIQAEVIQPFLAPYWRRPGRLEEVIEAAEQLRRSRYEDEQDQQSLAAARAAFAAGDYVRSIELYGLAREALSDSDRQRVKIARDELGRRSCWGGY
jgi:hypothetical protein